ncbi:Rossmann-like and DUF2520 domain-containing protein [Caldithrix abyssi]
MQNALVIGCGKVGSSLFNLLVAAGFERVFVVDTIKCFNKEWAPFLGADSFFNDLAALPEAHFDLLAICTPDDQIEEVVGQLSDRSLKAERIFHTSGSKTADLLQPLKSGGAIIGSLHPLQSFTRLFLPPEIWRGIVCTFQGDLPLFTYLQTIMQPFGSKIVAINIRQKRQLHLAATIAANFQVALYSWAEQILKDAQLTEGDLNQLLGPLIRRVGQNLNEQPLSRILSGPLQRGDEGTIHQHFSILKENNRPHDAPLYRLLSLKLLENPQFEILQREKLKKLLENYET